MTAKTIRFFRQEFTAPHWARRVADAPGLNLMQCWEYAEAKARTGPWRVERGLFTDDGAAPAADDGNVIGAAQVLIRMLPLDLGGLAWINRGPLALSGKDGDRLADMMAALGDHYARGRGLYLRLAPPVPAEAFDVAAAGLAVTDTPGWASAGVDLHQPLDRLRANLNKKWRNGLKKAERSGIEIRNGTGDDLFARFLESHVRMTEEIGAAAMVAPELLRVLRELRPGGVPMETFLAFRDGDLLGGVLMVRYGGTCEYLAGNVSGAGRPLSAGQLLLWRAVETMKAQGCRRFDLGGMDEVLTPPGIFRFKAGLGGTPYRLAPEVEALGGGLVGRLVRWRVARAVQGR
ncbi:MAG: GNAT family N-acetyltransferase [Rhodospirillales bacterium]|nr:GNAT family N-acetyltransferase [Rhodospirillales bacterium]